MRNPFNFEAEPFEFDSEFDEYEYEEEQSDTYSEFGDEYESDFEGDTLETYPEYEEMGELFEEYEDDFPTPPRRLPPTPSGTIPVGPLQVHPICRAAHLDLLNFGEFVTNLNSELRRSPPNRESISRVANGVRSSMSVMINRSDNDEYIRQGCTNRDLIRLANMVRAPKRGGPWLRLRGMSALRRGLIRSIRRAARRARVRRNP